MLVKQLRTDYMFFNMTQCLGVLLYDFHNLQVYILKLSSL